MNHSSFVIIRRVHITKMLNAVRCVDVHIKQEGLTEGLNFFSSSPDATLPALCHLAVEALFVVLRRRSVGGSGRTGGVSDSGRSSPSRSSTFTTSGSDEGHEVILVCIHMIRKTGTNLLSVVEVTVDLVGQGVIETIAYE